ncbi:MAG: hypothetical protein WAZ19_04300 [Anaerolineae bacterium]
MSHKRVSLGIVLLVVMALLAACGGGAATPAAPAATAAPAEPTPTPDLLDGWVTFTAPDTSFTVRMPKEPEADEQTVPTEAGDITVAMYSVEADNHMVLVGQNGFPESIAETIATGDEEFVQSMLDGGRDGAIGNVSGTLVDEKRITVDGFPAREFTFNIAPDASPLNADITGTARVILTKDRLYQLISLQETSKATPDVIQAFFDSFQLTAGQ